MESWLDFLKCPLYKNVSKILFSKCISSNGYYTKLETHDIVPLKHKLTIRGCDLVCYDGVAVYVLDNF